MKLIMIAAVSMAFASAARANTNDIIVQDGPTARITYGDLNLRSGAGRQALTQRIRSAAGLLCLEDNVVPLQEKLDRMYCYRTAVASGLTRMEKLAH